MLVIDRTGYRGRDVSRSSLSIDRIYAAGLIETLSTLPLHLFKKTGDEREKATGDPLYAILKDRPNAIHSKPAFWRWAVTRLMLHGRAIILIVRNRAGKVTSLIPLDAANVKIEQKIRNGDLVRTYRVGSVTYDSNDVLDFALHLKADGVEAYNPLTVHRDAIGLIIAVERYAATLFGGDGVPPLSLTVPAGSSPRGQEKGANEISELLKMARNKNRKIIPVLPGFELKQIGFDPSKNQLVELRQFQIAEVARIFNVAPALLYDLSNGTFSNFSQQALMFATNTIAPIVKLIEAELNQKLFGARNTANFAEFDMGGLLRGDITTRYEAYDKAIKSGFLTPNEARAHENRAPIAGGDEGFIQGAMVTLEAAAKGKAEGSKASEGEPDDKDRTPD
jgi:HK97 family phage portal protein